MEDVELNFAVLTGSGEEGGWTDDTFRGLFVSADVWIKDGCRPGTVFKAFTDLLMVGGDSPGFGGCCGDRNWLSCGRGRKSHAYNFLFKGESGVCWRGGKCQVFAIYRPKWRLLTSGKLSL